MEKDYKALDELCRKHIELYDEKVRIAWNNMDRWRCPFRMAGNLYDEIVDVLESYLDDFDWDEWDEDDIENIISAEVLI